VKIGDELRKARLAAGLSQKELAERAELARTYVTLLERDGKSPTLDTFARICKALDISPTTLMSRAEKAQRRKK
jgi:transcriptional regulator with XRE-family HTH domain